jgi:hypothetical protein
MTPDCTTKYKAHVWNKWVFFKASSSAGFEDYDNTMRRTCKKCGWIEKVKPDWIKQ